MSNDTENDNEQQDEQILDDELIESYTSDKEIIKFVQSKFNRLSRLGAINLLTMILKNVFTISAYDIIKKPKTFIRYNLSNFEDDHLKDDVLISIRRELNGFLLEKGKDTPDYSKTVKGVQEFVLNKHIVYEKVRKFICDEGGEVNLFYNFNTPDINIDTLKNKDTLQRSYIQILSKGIKFDYPIEYVYSCIQCNHKDRKSAYLTASTKTKLKCGGIFSYVNANGEPRSRVCNTSLYPDDEISTTKDAYYYDIGYEDESGNKYSVGAFSFNLYPPGFYEAVLFKVKNPKKTDLYHIIDIKSSKSNEFKLPEDNILENYVFTLQKSFDVFIKRQTNVDVYGLIPIKIAMIIQAVVAVLGMRLIFNLQIVGDASTGKSLVLKYYGYLLNNSLNLSTNGLSISVAGLRGTRNMISLMGREQKIITTGHLGSYRCIHIDEAGENKELIKNLKSFLLEENYSYNRAGSDGTFNKRTAQCNVSENLDYTHLGQYRGSIKKAYKEHNSKIGESEIIPWDEEWDLYLPLYKYDNIYLHKIIMDKRIDYKQKQVFWLDGYDYALHERFPFYFYLVNEHPNPELDEVIKENVSKNTISEILALIKVLRSEDIENFFKGLKEYKDSKEDKKSFLIVDEILEQYGMKVDARMKTFYYTLVKVSRIINQRMTIEKTDYDLLRWLIEKIGVKLDITQTNDYEIEGPPNLNKQKEIEEKIETFESKKNEAFGLPDGEFE